MKLKTHISLAVIFLLTLPMSSCKKEKPQTPLEFVSNEAVFVLLVDDISKFLKGYSELIQIFKGDKLEKDIKEITAGVTKTLGFNPFDPKEIKRAGISPEGTLVLALDAGSRVPYFVLSVENEKKLSSVLKKMAQNHFHAKEYETEKVGKKKIHIISRASKNKKQRVLSYAFKGGSAVIVPSGKWGTGTEKAKKVISRDGTGSIINAELYKELKTKLKKDKHFLFYANKWIAQVLPGKSRTRKNIRKTLKGIIGGANLSLQGIDFKLFTAISKKHIPSVIPLLKSGSPSPGYKGIAYKNAILAFKLSLSPEKILEEIFKNRPESKKKFEENSQKLKKEYEFDFKKDFIEKITGNVILAHYIEPTEELSNLDINKALKSFSSPNVLKVIAVVQFNDEKATEEFKDKLLAIAKKTTSKIKTYKSNTHTLYSIQLPEAPFYISGRTKVQGPTTVFWTVHKRDALFSFDLSTLEKAVTQKGNLFSTRADTRFLNALSEPDTQLLYISFNTLSKTFQQSASQKKPSKMEELVKRAFLKKVINILKHLGNITIVAKSLSDGISFEGKMALQ